MIYALFTIFHHGGYIGQPKHALADKTKPVPRVYYVTEQPVASFVRVVKPRPAFFGFLITLVPDECVYSVFFKYLWGHILLPCHKTLYKLGVVCDPIVHHDDESFRVHVNLEEWDEVCEGSVILR